MIAKARVHAAAALFGAVVTCSDFLPPRIRYGYVHRITRRFLARPLDFLPSVVRLSEPRMPAIGAGEAPVSCALLTGSMDVGGIGSVVEILAAALSSAGLRPVIVTTHSGTRADRLRGLGLKVVVVGTDLDARQVLRDLAPSVIQLHGAPESLEEAAIASGIPFIPVLHNMEIHHSRARWRRLARLLAAAPAAIAVSETVRAYHYKQLPPSLGDRIRVVGNAIPAGAVTPSREQRETARARLAEVLRTDLGDDVVFVCLARFDSQKNLAGLVASFLSSVEDRSIRLVVAGEPSDWAEVRRADAIRRCSRHAGRVSLLASSDARSLLSAADGFVLDSFFEGWPVAATEASAMGLPLVLADFGGARELVARDPAHSVLVANACGSAEDVSDAVVARARRRSRRQANANELGAAITAVAARVRNGDRPPTQPIHALMHEMTEGHAALLREVAVSMDGATAQDLSEKETS
ncbi:glycosyltransferase [Microbacterium invictum]|uniref:Glycosyltransferase involved in cell wall biosynthesis n=1 Tax=Microbacterium invictum TaxID=515415 RepID=A0AA40SPH7_9MICO|nr:MULTISPECIES: glycosyltransferase [Microbacterium]MBB4140038.1 glycosyltransferase involved in cell wall biosynthesis [Microbacterium invictum]